MYFTAFQRLLNVTKTITLQETEDALLNQTEPLTIPNVRPRKISTSWSSWKHYVSPCSEP